MRWAVAEMDDRFVPESAAEKVLELVDDEPEFFDGMPGVDRLAQLVDAARLEGDGGPGRVALREFLIDLSGGLQGA